LILNKLVWSDKNKNLFSFFDSNHRINGLQMISWTRNRLSFVEGPAVATRAVSAPVPVPATAMTFSPMRMHPPSQAIKRISRQTLTPWPKETKDQIFKFDKSYYLPLYFQI
jgi:hypothetical protein